jgi:hypothetical protein
MVLLTVYIAVLREKATMRELREDGGRVCLWQCAREATTRTRAIATDCQLHGFQFAGLAVLPLLSNGVLPFLPVRD